MWTEAHRARHEARLKEMVTQNAAGEVARWLERADPPRSEQRTPAEPVVAALAWHLRVGGPWRAASRPGAPSMAFRAWRAKCWRQAEQSSAESWFRRWLKLGLFEALLREMARRRRRAVGRGAAPSLCIIDTQAVKCLGVRGPRGSRRCKATTAARRNNVPPRGYDAGKKVLGRKRVALVDAEGHLLAVAVVPASRQDRDTLPALDAGMAAWPSPRAAIVDGAFAAERCREWSERHGLQHQVAARDPAAKGFVVIARRWVVERTFGWLSHWNGLVRDRAGRLDVSAGRIALAAVISGVEAVINPMPVQKLAA